MTSSQKDAERKEQDERSSQWQHSVRLERREPSVPNPEIASPSAVSCRMVGSSWTLAVQAFPLVLTMELVYQKGHCSSSQLPEENLPTTSYCPGQLGEHSWQFIRFRV